MQLVPMIRERRMEAHLSQTKLANLLKITKSRMSLIENGKHFPLPYTLWKIAHACGCKVDDLYKEID